MYILEVVGGPLDGKRWEFEREITIGRDDGAATACITLDPFISRVHARLRSEGDGFVLVDLASRNGTRLGARRIEADTHLAQGEPFTVGRTVLRVARAGD